MSSEVFAGTGAKAASISFADTISSSTGRINAVLSSGDGGAGRKLWEYLPCFTAITYSLPLSVASVNQAVYDGLDPALREAVDAARLKANYGLLCRPSCKRINYQRMRQNGVSIEFNPAPAVIEALHNGAPAVHSSWCNRSGPVCSQILDALKEGRP
jgi:TRAP-type C4-dicarboxylate transport system substrate-binding protein